MDVAFLVIIFFNGLVLFMMIAGGNPAGDAAKYVVAIRLLHHIEMLRALKILNDQAAKVLIRELDDPTDRKSIMYVIDELKRYDGEIEKALAKKS